MNHSSNHSGNFALRVELQREAFHKYQIIPLSTIVVIGFLANVTVIHAGMKKNNRLKYATNAFILNLAAADLGMIVFYIPIHFVEYTIGLQCVSDWTCRYIIPIRETFSIMSVITVGVLGIVRIVQLHFKYVLSIRLTNFLIVCMWFVAYVTVSLPMSTVYRRTSENTCDPFWESEEKKKIHVAFINILLFVWLLITNLCYFCIIVNVRNFNQRFTSPEQNKLEQKSQKVSILLFFLIVATWLSLVPYLIYSMLLVFSEIYNDMQYPYQLWSIMAVLFTSTCAINPVLILTTNKEYRKEIRNTFYRRHRIAPLQQVEIKTAKPQQKPPMNTCPEQSYSVDECV